MDELREAVRGARLSVSVQEGVVKRRKEAVAEARAELAHQEASLVRVCGTRDRLVAALDVLCNEPPNEDAFRFVPLEIVTMIAGMLSLDDRQNLAMTCKEMWRMLGPYPERKRKALIMSMGMMSKPISMEGRSTRLTPAGSRKFLPVYSRIFHTVVAAHNGVIGYRNSLDNKCKITYKEYVIRRDNTLVCVALHPTLELVCMLVKLWKGMYRLVVWDPVTNTQVLMMSGLSGQMKVTSGSVRVYHKHARRVYIL